MILRGPWYDDETGGGALFEHPATGGTFHCQLRSDANDNLNDTLLVGVGRSGSALWGISLEDATLHPTIVILGVVKAVAPSFVLSTAGVFHRLHLVMDGEAENDTWTLYEAGDLTTPIASYVLTATDAANLLAAGRPNEWWFQSGQVKWIDDVWLLDPNDGVGETNINRLLSGGIRGAAVNADTATADWAGSFADIDEIPVSDVDGINTVLPAQTSLFGKAALSGTAPTIAAVKVNVRITRSDTLAGQNLAVIMDDGAEDARQVAAPGDGWATVHFHEDPSAVAWTPASYDAADLGFRSVI